MSHHSMSPNNGFGWSANRACRATRRRPTHRNLLERPGTTMPQTHEMIPRFSFRATKIDRNLLKCQAQRMTQLRFAHAQHLSALAHFLAEADISRCWNALASRVHEVTPRAPAKVTSSTNHQWPIGTLMRMGERSQTGDADDKRSGCGAMATPLHPSHSMLARAGVDRASAASIKPRQLFQTQRLQAPGGLPLRP